MKTKTWKRKNLTKKKASWRYDPVCSILNHKYKLLIRIHHPFSTVTSYYQRIYEVEVIIKFALPSFHWRKNWNCCPFHFHFHSPARSFAENGPRILETAFLTWTECTPDLDIQKYQFQYFRANYGPKSCSSFSFVSPGLWLLFSPSAGGWIKILLLENKHLRKEIFDTLDHSFVRK